MKVELTTPGTLAAQRLEKVLEENGYRTVDLAEDGTLVVAEQTHPRWRVRRKR